MADKSFGVKELNLLNASGTPTITSPNNLNLNANNVAISTNVTIGGNLTVSGNIGISSLNVTGISTFTDIQVAEKIIHVGDADTDISFGTDSINFKVGGNTKLNASANGLTAYDKLIPDADNSHLLGQGSGPQKRWSQVHAVTFHGDGSNLTGISAGISTSPSNVQATWKLGGGSGSGFTFTGPGQDGSEGNPNIYLVRGQRYLFDNTTLAGNHPFAFRNAANNADYTDGVSGAQNGLQYINVQHDAPAQLKYRCTIHQNSMLGNIYIVGGPQLGEDLDTNTKNIKFGDSASHGASGDDTLIFGADDDMRMYHDGSNGFISNNTGAFVIQDSHAGANAIVIRKGAEVEILHNNALAFETSANGLAFPNGKGIDFSATGGPTNGTGSSELFDDYEEGSWTPSVATGTAGGVGNARYVKIGRVVHVEGGLSNFSDQSSSTAIKITGFPFALTFLENAKFTCSLSRVTQQATGQGAIVDMLHNTSTAFPGLQSNSASTGTSIRHQDLNHNAASIIFSGTYTTN